MKHWQNQALVWGFMICLTGAAALGEILPEQIYSETENRYLQRRPRWSAEQMLDGSFGKEYETWLSDQFPGRNQWVAVKAMAERVQLRTDFNGVYMGKDGYWMEKFETEDVEGELLDRNLDRLSQWVIQCSQKLGADRVKVMLVPTASQVLKDKLPLFAAPYDQEQVVQRIAQLVGAHQVVELDARTWDFAKNQGPVFYQTDHHWTALGAYCAYRTWAGSTGRTAWEPEAFEVQTVSTSFLGTLHAKVNLMHSPDTIQLYIPKHLMEYQVYYDGSGEPVNTLFARAALATRDQYRVYLDGNHGLTQIENRSAGPLEQGKRLLLVKDSFAHSIAPFLVNHFETTCMVDLRYYRGSLEDLMEEQGITDILVLYQIPGFAVEKSVRFY